MYFSPPPTDGRLQIVQSKSLVDLASDGDLREIVINANIMLGMDKRKFSFPFQIETQNCIVSPPFFASLPMIYAMH